MQNSYIVLGELIDDHTVSLDKPLPLTQKKVRLVIEPLPVSSEQSYSEVMADIRTRQQRRAHKRPTREEVDANLEAERESWE